MISFNFSSESDSYQIFIRSTLSTGKLARFEIPKEHDGKIIDFISCTLSPYQHIAFEKGTTLKNISLKAFIDNTALVSIRIPASVKIIEKEAFFRCPRLEEVTFEDGCELSRIKSYAFMNCRRLKSFTILHSLKIIGEKSFSGCDLLDKVYVEENSELKIIKNEAFDGCSRMTPIFNDEHVLYLPSIEYIGKSAFNKCHELSELKFGTKLKEIHSYAFYFCNQIKSVVFQSSPSVMYEAFLNWSFKLFLPAEFKNIDAHNIHNIKDLELLGNPKFIMKEWNILYSKSFSSIIRCDSLASRALIRKGIESLSCFSFSSCSRIKTIFMPDTVRTIGKAAFSSCILLNKVRVSPNVGMIPDDCFLYCRDLKKIIIPRNSKLTRIGQHAFNWTGITKIYFPKNLRVLNSRCLPLTLRTIITEIDYDYYALNNEAFEQVNIDWYMVKTFNQHCFKYINL